MKPIADFAIDEKSVGRESTANQSFKSLNDLPSRPCASDFSA